MIATKSSAAHLYSRLHCVNRNQSKTNFVNGQQQQGFGMFISFYKLRFDLYH